MARLRIRFTKLGKIRWTSHRDLARMWERAFRRVGLPLAYTSGFTPRPKVSFGLALPTGHESLAEYLDLDLAEGTELDLDGLAGRLSAALPVGVDATAVSVIDDRAPSLQEEVTSSTWIWRVARVTGADADTGTDAGGAPDPIGTPLTEAELRTAVAGVLTAHEVVVPRTRKGVTAPEDIRGGILDLRVVPTGPTGEAWLQAELRCQPRSLRPADVVAALGPDAEERSVRRLHQWISRDGAQWEPLDQPAAPADATDAPHALGRAS